ncbi:hypothetical protein N7492_006433 [Penicillium capsulatum]|uniref:Uncharacterized protein n=1 Tax=Penicillium capsulatum TaxID=69766 RepID=A0A9W9LL53_9EURO|nr:hypothetical protein N7492_006433 [Penicillium capsulatum]KAJ6116273.1 hypothetical protein N7512_005998 [Penicillium capsulatum]
MPRRSNILTKELGEVGKAHPTLLTLGHGSYLLIHGPTTEVIFQTSPPQNAVAVVVDISSTGGAIKIGEASDNDLGVTAVGMVGTEDADGLVIVPWDSGWWYYTIGVITVRYIVKA